MNFLEHFCPVLPQLRLISPRWQQDTWLNLHVLQYA